MKSSKNFKERKNYKFNIRNKTKVQDTIANYIQTQQLKWFGKIQRMKEKQPKGIWEWRPGGRICRERPKVSWNQGIYML